MTTNNEVSRAAEHHAVMTAIGKAKPTKKGRKKLVKSPILPPKPKKAKTPKRKAAKPDPDYWFSLCVRERSNWICDNCGKYYEPWTGVNGEPANPGLHCSHYIGRANYATRFDPVNVSAHCYGCHSKFEGDPDYFQEWKREEIGNEEYEALILRKKESGKHARKARQEIADFYKAEFRKMQSARSLSGWNGRLEFASFGALSLPAVAEKEQV